MAEELECVKVFNFKNIFYLAPLLVIASCGGGGNSASNLNGSPDASSSAAKVVIKNSSVGTSAFVVFLLVTD
jgi:hypothetical protein